MRPILTVEFNAGSGETGFKEESVPLHNPAELLSFVAPGGGCEAIPDEVSEIQFIFLPPEHANIKNPVSDAHASLQLGMVVFSGPLSEILQTIELIIDKAGRGELSESFLRSIA